MAARAGSSRRLTRLVAASVGFALAASAVVAAQPSQDRARLAAGEYVLRATDRALPGLLHDVRASGGTVRRTLDLVNGAAVTVDSRGAEDLAVDDRVVALTPDVTVTAAVPPRAADLVAPAPTKTTAHVAPKIAKRAAKGAGAAPTGGVPGNVDVPVDAPADAPVKAPVTAPVAAPVAGPVESAYDAASDPNSLCNIAKLVGVRQLWKAGGTGKGVDVALIDSGVAPVTGLAAPGQVLNGPDLTPESQNPATRYLDTFGHGTHMAGIIAGRDPGLETSKANSCERFAGMAPDSRIVSVKVADAHGATDVSQVIAGIDWVVQHAHDPGMNIRVLNLSYGTDSTQSFALDPLAFAAEVAWRKGIVVVVSAGNSGFDDGRLTNPARSPHVLAVGADDTKGTMLTLDDTIPSFSSRGDAKRNPDIVAPGKSVQSLRVPGSYIDVAHGDTGRLAGRFFRGSGTSQAAAVTSGAVAALISARPQLTPDQVRLLVATLGLGLVDADPRAQGHGLLQLGVPSLVAALTGTLGIGGVTDLAAKLLTGANVAPSTGRGTLDGARGTERLELDGTTLTGERDIFGKKFDSAAQAGLAARGRAWSGGTWNGSDWAGNSWTGRSWASSVWLGRTWAGRTWAGRTWADGSWNGRTWAGGTWNGRTWAGVVWAGRTWAGSDFSGGDWQ